MIYNIRSNANCEVRSLLYEKPLIKHTKYFDKLYERKNEKGRVAAILFIHLLTPCFIII